MDTTSTLKLALELLTKEVSAAELDSLQILINNYTNQIAANTKLIQDLTTSLEDAEFRLNMYKLPKEELKHFIGNLIADFITEESIEVVVFQPPEKEEPAAVPETPVDVEQDETPSEVISEPVVIEEPATPVEEPIIEEPATPVEEPIIEEIQVSVEQPEVPVETPTIESDIQTETEELPESITEPAGNAPVDTARLPEAEPTAEIQPVEEVQPTETVEPAQGELELEVNTPQGLVSFAPFDHALDLNQKNKGVVLPDSTKQWKITQGLDVKAHKAFEYGYVDFPPYLGVGTKDARAVIEHDASIEAGSVLLRASIDGASQIIAGKGMGQVTDAAWEVQAVLPEMVEGICAVPIAVRSGPPFTHAKGLSFSVEVRATYGKIEAVYTDGNMSKTFFSVEEDWGGKENIWRIACRPSSGFVRIYRDGEIFATIFDSDDLNNAEWIDTYMYPVHEIYMPKSAPFNNNMPPVVMELKARGYSE